MSSAGGLSSKQATAGASSGGAAADTTTKATLQIPGGKSHTLEGHKMHQEVSEFINRMPGTTDWATVDHDNIAYDIFPDFATKWDKQGRGEVKQAITISILARQPETTKEDRKKGWDHLESGIDVMTSRENIRAWVADSGIYIRVDQLDGLVTYWQKKHASERKERKEMAAQAPAKRQRAAAASDVDGKAVKKVKRIAGGK